MIRRPLTDQVSALLSRRAIEQLREALLRDFTGQQVRDVLQLVGEAALGRSDLAGAERLTRGGTSTETWIRLFLLGEPVSPQQAAAAIAPLPIDEAVLSGLLRFADDSIRAGMDLRPYSETSGPDWWVISDLGSDVRTGTLDPEHVLGIGSAALTLAQAIIRRPVGSALDIGTGCGVQSLHLSRHAQLVTATDLSLRALRMAATTAALNGLSWDLRQGSLLEPIQVAERFDLIVCNPPFIVGPGLRVEEGGFTYRDSGLAGDEVCRRLVTQLPGRLAFGGTAQLLANWQIMANEDWQERLAGWVSESGCDGWVWQREVAEPGEYVSMWLRDAGLRPGEARWRAEYNSWLDWFAATGVIAVGMGLVSLRRTDAPEPVVVCEDVPQPVEQPIGHEIAGWFERARWLAEVGPDGLRRARLHTCDGLVLDNRSLIDGEGWQVVFSQLRQSSGMRWEVESDAAISGLVAACNGTLPVRALLEVLASAHGLPAEQVADQLLPIITDLCRRGILLPARAGEAA